MIASITAADKLPVARATSAFGTTREILIRRIQLGEIEGGYDETRAPSQGRWWVSRQAVEAALAARKAAARTARRTITLSGV
jgi:hypothetical protein